MTEAKQAIVVTGASGALGLEFIGEAAQRWTDIICLLRSPSAASAVLNAAGDYRHRIRIVQADLTDRESMQAAAREIGALPRALGVHAAADVSWERSASDMAGLNVDGARNFGQLMLDTVTEPRLIYLSTAYTSTQDWTYRNGYEETKAQAEILLRSMFEGHPFSVFACSLVVGHSQTGAITRHNGIYPMLRFLAEFKPPFLVGKKTGQLDLVPVNWVVDELLALCDEHLRGDAPRDVIAAAGPGGRIAYERMVRLAEERINLFRVAHGHDPMIQTPILKGRQWAFLQRSLRAWQPAGIGLGDFRLLERLLRAYGIYSESDTVRDPVGVTQPPPSPEMFMPVVIDRWLEDHQDRLVAGFGARLGKVG